MFKKKHSKIYPTQIFNDNRILNKVYIRGYWNWNIHNETCAICRNNIFESPNGSNKIPNSVIGTCNHAFHYDCISSWIKNNSNCPLCNKRWVFKNKTIVSVQDSSLCNFSEETMTND